MPVSPSPIDPDRCPRCGQPNACAMRAQESSGIPQPPCWCTRVQIDAQLIDQLPPAARGVACLCAACAQRKDAT